MEFNQREQIIALTAQWSGERFEDGRPRVPDPLLEALRGMTLEEIWMPLYLKGYVFQYAGGLQTLHSGKKLVGRAVTCTFAPTRPDLAAVVKSEGKAHGWQGAGNQWVVDCLTEGDVIVADMFDKVYNGTFVGGNLTTAIAAKTKTGGAVIWGGVRDLEQMEKIHAVQVYYRGVDPTPIRECVAVGINTPCRINQAICLPGDVVFGTTSGVLFIPSHLVQYAIDEAYKSHAKDAFGFAMLRKGCYTAAQIDSSVWSTQMLDDLDDFLAHDAACTAYRELDWSVERAAAQGDPAALAEVLRSCLR